MNKFSDYSIIAEQTIRNMQLPGNELAGLYEPITYGMTAGGKRLRPALLLMAVEAFGGDANNALEPALGIEMFHNFTLLHDDVMDNSDTRRGRPSVHAKWDVNRAILSGDTMLTLATELIAKVPDANLRRVLDIFNRMAIKVYEGQLLDMEFENRDDVSLEEYIRMTGDKTGALLGAAAEIGAILGGATDAEAEAMREFAHTLGVAFQIQDDWLDVYGDSTTFGKPIGGDINNNKKSFLMLTALADKSSDAQALREALRLPAGDTKVKVVTRIYDRMKISERCREEINRYSARALAALKRTSLNDDAKEKFRMLVDKLTGRKR